MGLPKKSVVDRLAASISLPLLSNFRRGVNPRAALQPSLRRSQPTATAFRMRPVGRDRVSYIRLQNTGRFTHALLSIIRRSKVAADRQLTTARRQFTHQKT